MLNAKDGSIDEDGSKYNPLKESAHNYRITQLVETIFGDISLLEMSSQSYI